jgi:hypothetical protein
MTLIYYDQRIRLEVFDKEWMMDAAVMMVQVPTQTIAAEVAGNPAVEIQR